MSCLIVFLLSLMYLHNVFFFETFYSNNGLKTVEFGTDKMFYTFRFHTVIFNKYWSRIGI